MTLLYKKVQILNVKHEHSLVLRFRFLRNYTISCCIYFKTQDGPQLLSEPKNITIDEFAMANLECSIDKYPKPNIVWKNLEHNEIVDQSLYTYVNSKTVALIFEHVTRNHTGVYACYDREHPDLSVKFGILVKCKDILGV